MHVHLTLRIVAVSPSLWPRCSQPQGLCYIYRQEKQCKNPAHPSFLCDGMCNRADALWTDNKSKLPLIEFNCYFTVVDCLSKSC